MKTTLLLCTTLGAVLLILGGCADRPPTARVHHPAYSNSDIAPVSATSQGPHPNLERWHP